MTTPRYQPTINGLVDALVAFLETELAELKLEAPSGTTPRAAQVFAYSLPPKRADTREKDDHPVIVVRASTGTAPSDGQRTKVKLLFGAFSESTEGWRDLGNMIQRTINLFMEHRTLGPFCHEVDEKPPEWLIYDEQPLPQWQAEMATLWSSPVTQWTAPTT
jgi:hypothetical protein